MRCRCFKECLREFFGHRSDAGAARRAACVHSVGLHAARYCGV